MFRQFNMPARAVIQRFGEEVLDNKILNAAKKNPYENITLIHAVYPRDDRNTTRTDNKNMPFASVYLDPGSRTVLSESGFEEFPYVAPRFLKASFEIGYGRSPAMTALPDIKMLNKMSG